MSIVLQRNYEERVMLTFFDDGVWCKRCQKFHPTLWWHRKYEEYNSETIMKDSFRGLVENRPGLVGLPADGSSSESRKAEVVEQILRLNLGYRKTYEAEESVCVICGAKTVFVSKETGRHVCSDECLYKENGWKEETDI